jgi:exosome complex RNA-binding protein Rrp4
LNGLVLITGKTVEDEQAALMAILRIENESHTSGLTDRIGKMLKEGKQKKEEEKNE